MSKTPSKSMLKDDIIGYVAEENNISKTLAGNQLESLTKLIRQQIATSGTFILTGIGKFSVVQRAARRGRNPRNGESIQIQARKVATFKPAKELRDAVE